MTEGKHSNVPPQYEQNTHKIKILVLLAIIQGTIIFFGKNSSFWIGDSQEKPL